MLLRVPRAELPRSRGNAKPEALAMEKAVCRLLREHYGKSNVLMACDLGLPEHIPFDLVARVGNSIWLVEVKRHPPKVPPRQKQRMAELLEYLEGGAEFVPLLAVVNLSTGDCTIKTFPTEYSGEDNLAAVAKRLALFARREAE